MEKVKHEVEDFTKRVDRGGLQSLQDLAIHDFVKVLKKYKSEIFHNKDVPVKMLARSTQYVCN